MEPVSPADGEDRRAGITLRELEVLQAIVAAGTSINAARRLNISQSAVSRRLTQLEDRLGFQLFRREGGRLVPTVEALSINEQLTSVFDTLARIANHSSEPPKSLAGRLSIVAPPTIAHRFLPARIAAFNRRNPGLHISFDVLASDSLYAGIAEGHVDVGITDSAVSHDGIQIEPLLETQAICIFPKHHRFASLDVIRPEDLRNEPFIALSRRHSGRAVIDRLFDRAGVALNRVMEASTNVSVSEFVREGVGVSLLNPFPLVHQMGDQIVMRPFLPAITYTTSFLMPASRAPSAATLSFMQFIRSGIDRETYPLPPLQTR
ncbi:LysR substrate-binding domain-containing protein [Falsirhodobacter sp. alg1]|uniref:LysR substrate-binding domain-containing protein n=1 Tax=Falsirhodobacter sp. alg1 TaxID=1472418 RepID=UPI0005EDE436|nr:LysR substrate-binding domain-containing protein [Falsirhodobacter sp. alg1]